MLDKISITIRFYEELNYFIKKYPQKQDIPFDYSGKRSVKDLIENFGVPPCWGFGGLELPLAFNASTNMKPRIISRDIIFIMIPCKRF